MTLARYDPGPRRSVGRGLDNRIEPSPPLGTNPRPCAMDVRDGHAARGGITVEAAPSGRRGG